MSPKIKWLFLSGYYICALIFTKSLDLPPSLLFPFIMYKLRGLASLEDDAHGPDMGDCVGLD